MREMTQAPSIANIVLPPTVNQFARLEITLDVTTQATDLYLPYDASPPAGQAAATGITVDAIFTDPDSNTYILPAFYHQSFQTQQGHGRDWIYPLDTYAWHVRFAPALPGTWTMELSATDGGGTVQEGPLSFDVQPSASRGFVRESQTDPRYFEYGDGSPFKGLGYNFDYKTLDWNDPSQATMECQTFANFGMDLARYWLSEPPLFGGLINPLRQWDADHTYDSFAGLTVSVADAGREVSWRLNSERGSFKTRFLALGALTESLPVKPGTQYRISLRLHIPENLLQDDLAQDFGFVVKQDTPILDPSLVVDPTHGTPLGGYVTGTGASWIDYAAEYTTPANQYFLPYLYFALVNCVADDKTAYFDDVQIHELSGGVPVGPNLLDKGLADQHLYVSQRGAHTVDQFVEAAEGAGITLKLVLLEKNDPIFGHMDRTTGLLDAAFSVDNFYGGEDQSINRCRWLQQAWWRYCQARWGYSAAVHSWELLNEGGINNPRHENLAQMMGSFMAQYEPNSHPCTTSFWSGFDHAFWTNPAFPDMAYADWHKYIEPTDSYWGDTARAHIDGVDGLQPVDKPVVRGETMVWDDNDPHSYEPRLLEDTAGTWLRHWLWSQLHSKQLYELWWYHRNVISQTAEAGVDQRPHILAFSRFLEGIPLNNGTYQDLGVSAQDLLVVGQWDTASGDGHLWVRADGAVPYTWLNVVNSETITPVSEDITIPGLFPDRAYTVQNISTADGVTLLDEVGLFSDAQGNLLVRGADFPSLLALLGDTAFKFQAQPESQLAPILLHATFTETGVALSATDLAGNEPVCSLRRFSRSDGSATTLADAAPTTYDHILKTWMYRIDNADLGRFQYVARFHTDYADADQADVWALGAIYDAPLSAVGAQSLSTAALAQFVTHDTGESSAASASVAELSKASGFSTFDPSTEQVIADVRRINGDPIDDSVSYDQRAILYLQQLKLETDASGEGALDAFNHSPDGMGMRNEGNIGMYNEGVSQGQYNWGRGTQGAGQYNRGSTQGQMNEASEGYGQENRGTAAGQRNIGSAFGQTNIGTAAGQQNSASAGPGQENRSSSGPGQLNIGTDQGLLNQASAGSGQVNQGTVKDVDGYDPDIVAGFWDRLTSTLTSAGSIGKLLADTLDATLSSRSSHSADDVITGLPTAADTDTQLSTTHGAGSWEAGTPLTSVGEIDPVSEFWKPFDRTSVVVTAKNTAGLLTIRQAINFRATLNRLQIPADWDQLIWTVFAADGTSPLVQASVSERAKSLDGLQVITGKAASKGGLVTGDGSLIVDARVGTVRLGLSHKATALMPQVEGVPWTLEAVRDQDEIARVTEGFCDILPLDGG